ncbi:unnamed protein product [Effrenium voratum]|nr:unnamed protein product [Effrenium voratum]
MQLEPSRLQVQSEDAAESRDLRGQWLPLFRGSAPYVAMFRNSIMVFHIPGHLLADPQSSELEGLLGDIALCALLGVRPVLVPSLSQRIRARLAAECGQEVDSMSDNLEAICTAAFKNREAVMRFMKQEAGMLCAEVQDLFLRVAAKPTGNFDKGKSLSVFASSQLVSTAPQRASSGWQRSPILGRVTEIDAVQIDRRLREEQVVCVLPVAAGSLRGDGSLRYVPSEKLAAQIAEELKATKLIFFTRGQRIVDTVRGNAIPTMQLGEASKLLDYAKDNEAFMEQEESREIIRYLELLLQALRSGTRRGHLIDPKRGALLQELYTTDGSGTMISLDLYDGIRLARSGDVTGILELIEPLVKSVVCSSAAVPTRLATTRRCLFGSATMSLLAVLACRALQTHLAKQSWVASSSLRFVGAKAMVQCSYPTWRESPRCWECHLVSLSSTSAQVCVFAYVCVSVHVREVKLALAKPRSQLFLLTTQTMQWFVERGFRSATLDDLPPGKREGYDLGRSSKVFIKDVSELPSELQQRFTFIEVDTLD